MVEVFLNNATKKIEGEYHQSHNLDAPVVLILHHHAQYGGSLNTKMIHGVYNTFIANNFSALKINFRGVEKFIGTIDKGIGELTDAAVAVDWIQEHHFSKIPIWIFGFSFGAWIAMQLTMRRPEIVGFIVISPPVTRYDFSFLSPCPVPGLIIQGSHDIISEKSHVTELATRLINSLQSHYMEYYIVENTNHFLSDKEEEVMQIIDRYIKLRLHDNVITI
ncbi:alpha/beta hydrolase [Wolbachia endosymbiont of Howardula sp.]|uniref:alpha/beta hydrolase n=1 Tax=Wolbachia endosymbiont of Howardula sp. TaxID=2916816 RepID=UPI00217D56A4|nr:alpha/beta hydrolase [Wolbachia endosymbiont of Howardula sp.]UWI83305.1 alpha/beta hydrolase [Wolbachia endosymbiont of Howardula sp.]